MPVLEVAQQVGRGPEGDGTAGQGAAPFCRLSALVRGRISHDHTLPWQCKTCMCNLHFVNGMFFWMAEQSRQGRASPRAKLS